MKDLEKMLMSKKDKSKMSDQEVQAKMDVLMELMEMAKDALGSKVKSGMDEMQKVSVSAPDKESLEEGLEKAQELVEKSPDMMMEEKEELPGMPKKDEMMMKKEKSKRKLFSMLDEDEE